MARIRRARARLRAQKSYVKRNMMNFTFFTNMAGQRHAFRVRRSSARQSILLITEMLFDYLIAIVSVKAAEIGMSEVAEKLDTSAPPPRAPVNGR